VPTGLQWAYEIKHDGFRFICHRDGDGVRLFSRGRHDWAGQLPAIAEAIRALSVTSLTLDGEVVVCGDDGISQFDCMRVVFSRQGSRDAFLYAFDVLELDGRDLRGQRWDGRRALLAQLLNGADAARRRSLTQHRVWPTPFAAVVAAFASPGLLRVVERPTLGMPAIDKISQLAPLAEKVSGSHRHGWLDRAMASSNRAHDLIARMGSDDQHFFGLPDQRGSAARYSTTNDRQMP
jgi:hypothetical protein